MKLNMWKQTALFTIALVFVVVMRGEAQEALSPISSICESLEQKIAKRGLIVGASHDAKFDRSIVMTDDLFDIRLDGADYVALTKNGVSDPIKKCLRSKALTWEETDCVSTNWKVIYVSEGIPQKFFFCWVFK